MKPSWKSRLKIPFLLSTLALFAPTDASASERKPKLLMSTAGCPGSLVIQALDAPVNLEKKIRVEHHSNGECWDVDAKSLSFSSSREFPGPPCAELAAEEPKRIFAWSGLPCTGQCDGTCGSTYQRPGRYPFVARTFDHKHAFYRAPIRLIHSAERSFAR